MAFFESQFHLAFLIGVESLSRGYLSEGLGLFIAACGGSTETPFPAGAEAVRPGRGF